MKLDIREKLTAYHSNLLFAISVFWFAVRVIPKPSRVMYPCQRTTLTLIALRLGMGLSIVVTTLTGLARLRVVKVLVVSLLVAEIAFPTALVGYYSVRYSLIAPPSMTLQDVQVSFARDTIVRVHSANATSWDFTTPYYWQHVDQSVVDRMVEAGVQALTNTSDAQAGWASIINYTSGDIVGLKINGNDMPPYITDQNSINTLPQVIRAVVGGVKSLGVPEADIWVIEPTGSAGRLFFSYYSDIIHSAYPDVRLVDADDISFGSHPELLVNFPYTDDRHITDQLWDIDHLIMIPVLKVITPDWGVTGAIKMMQGNIADQAGLHDYIGRTTADNPHVLIYQNPNIIGKTRLIVGDGLFGAWTGMHFEGSWGGADTLQPPNHQDEVPNPWITFDNGAPNCLFFGVDPVALDCVMYDHLLAERTAQDQVPGQSLAHFLEPQLQAGAAAGIGIRDHGPPYTSIDYQEVEVAGEEHDLAVVDIALSPTVVPQGANVSVNVTVANQGQYAEVFNASVHANASIIATFLNVHLANGTSILLTCSWNTSTVDKGDYPVMAYLPPVPDEANVADNRMVAGSPVTVLSLGHDIAVTSVHPAKRFLGEGFPLALNVTAKNYGSFPETFNLTAYINTTVVGTAEVAMASGEATTITFTWNTSGLTKGSYTLAAAAGPVPDEVDAGDNMLEAGIILLTLRGDVDGDRDVDIYDIVQMAGLYGVAAPNPNYDPTCDIDGDGDIDIYDIVAACGHYGESW